MQLIIKNGAPHPKLVEPVTTRREISVVWRRPKIDHLELLDLKESKGLSRKQLAEHFERPIGTINWYLNQFRRKNHELDRRFI